MTYVLVLGLYYIYLICICIFYVIWQLNALNGFSFQLLKYFSNNIFYFSKKETNYLFILRDLSYFLLYI